MCVGVGGGVGGGSGQRVRYAGVKYVNIKLPKNEKKHRIPVT